LISDNLTVKDNVNLSKLINERELFEKQYNREPTIKELQEVLNMSKEEIEELLIIEKRVDTTSIYDEELDLIDDSLEDTIADILSRESVRKIVDILPDMQRKCLLLYFGFGDKPYYTYDEIAAEFNISREGVRQSILDGLENINKSVRKHVLNIVCYDKIENDTLEKSGIRQSNYLFYFLLRQMPKGMILEMLDSLSERNKDTLILYLGLEDGIEHTREELAQKFEGVAVVEAAHERRYLKLLESYRNGKTFKGDAPLGWKCNNCGYVHNAEDAPEVCPVCDHPLAHFERKVENY
jgi:rubrerythrin